MRPMPPARWMCWSTMRVSDSQPRWPGDDQSWDRVLDNQPKGAWRWFESARRMVAAGKGGSLINVTSILASRVAVGLYLAAKAGLAHLTRAMALELARHGIRVNALAPGYVMTDLNEAFRPARPATSCARVSPAAASACRRT